MLLTSRLLLLHLWCYWCPLYCWLHYLCKHPCFCLRPFCTSGPVHALILDVALIPAVACVSALVGGHAVTLAVACCWHHFYCLHHCYRLQPCYCWRPCSSWCSYLCLSLCFCWRTWCCCIPADALAPAVYDFTAVAGVLAVSSFPADPSLPILPGVQYLDTVLYVQWYLLLNRLTDYVHRIVIFSSIGISKIGLANLI